VAELAAYVDGKMGLAAAESTTGDTLKVAVLAALNIADELFRARSAEGTVNTHWRQKAEELERLVDEVIGVASSSSRPAS
jgi:cell division protein ZapA